MKNKRKCIVCDERAPEVPDRERMGRPIKRVCRSCHRDRLLSDLRRIELDRKVKHEAAEAVTTEYDPQR